ncbi:MAG: helical backbone metal receptor [Acidobacteriota bacterium]
MKILRSLPVFLFFSFMALANYSQRIITLAPALTEIVFDLGYGDKIVGNTKFCNFPAESEKITKVGGYLDMNLELLTGLEPDIIFFYPEHSQKLSVLSGRSKLIELKHNTIKDLLNSILKIGEELQIRKRAVVLKNNIISGLKAVKNRPSSGKKIKTLIIIGRDPSQLKNITIAGKGDFINEILEISGGINGYNGNIAYPVLSIESFVKVDPEVIIEFSLFEQESKNIKVLKLWENYNFIKAVQKKNIYQVREDFWMRPGPRIVKIAESLYKLLHKNKNI